MYLLPRGNRARHRRRGARALVTTTCVALLLGPASPVPSYASSGITGITDTIGSLSVQSDPETTRFVQTWDARFGSGPAFQAYLDSDYVYDDGFNELPDERKQKLVEALVQHWRNTVDGFEEGLDKTGEDPALPALEEVQGLTYAIIFAKEAFKKGLLAERHEPGANADPTGTPPAPPANEADPVAEKTAALAREAAQALADLLAGAGGDVADPLPDVAERPVAVDPGVTVKPEDVAGIDLPPVQEVLDDLFAGTIERPKVETPVDGVKSSLLNVTYRACARSASGVLACQSNLIVEVLPVNTQVSLPATTGRFDVDSNGSIDVEVGLAVNPLAAANAIAGTVVVRRLTAAGTNYEGWIEYLLPDNDKTISVGFDGRTAGLTPETRVTVTFTDLAGLNAGTSKIEAQVAHNGGNGVPTVVLRAAYASAATTAQNMAIVTTITRAPSTLTAKYTSNRTGSTTRHEARVTHSATTPDVAVVYTGTLNNAPTTASVTMQGLPSSVTAIVEHNESARTTAIDYSANASMAGLSAAVVSMYSNRLYVANASAASLPTSIGIDIVDRSLSYVANAPSGPLTGRYVEFTLGGGVGGFMTPSRGGEVELSSAPQAFSVSMPATGDRRVAINTPSPIALLKAKFFDNPMYLSANITVTNIPAQAELVLPSSTTPKAHWTSSTPVGSVAATLRQNAWQAGLTITNVPTSFRIDGTSLGMSTSANAGTTVDAWLSNTGYRPALLGDHAAVVRTVRSAPRTAYGSTISVDLAVSLHVSNIRSVELKTQLGETQFSAQAGNTTPFSVWLSNVDQPNSRTTRLLGHLSLLPNSISGTFSKAINTVTTNANPDLHVYFADGRTSTHPSLLGSAGLPTVHGLYARDSGSGSAAAVEGRLYLPGLPNSVTVVPGGVSMNNYRPASSLFEVDIEFDADPANAIRAYLGIAGLPLSTGFNASANWSSSNPSAGGGQAITRVVATTSASVGPLTAVLAVPQYGARAVVSNVPSAIDLKITEVEGKTTTEWVANAAIASIEADAYLGTSLSSLSARASLRLTDIPKKFTLVTGRDAGGNGQVLSYTSYDTSRRLDATITADGRLKTSTIAIQADFFFELIDLGHVVTASGGGASMSITSSPPTTKLLARVSATVSYSQTGSGTFNSGGWISYPYNYSATASGGVDKLTLTLLNFAHITATANFATKIEGNFGSVSVKWNALRFNVNARASVDVKFTTGKGTFVFPLASANYQAWLNIDIPFRIYAPGWHNILNVEFPIPPLWKFKGRVDIQPTQFDTRWLSSASGVYVGGSPGSTITRWVSPQVISPLVTDVITAAVVYGGGGFNGSAVIVYWWN